MQLFRLATTQTISWRKNLINCLVLQLDCAFISKVPEADPSMWSGTLKTLATLITFWLNINWSAVLTVPGFSKIRPNRARPMRPSLSNPDRRWRSELQRILASASASSVTSWILNQLLAATTQQTLNSLLPNASVSIDATYSPANNVYPSFSFYSYVPKFVL